MQRLSGLILSVLTLVWVVLVPAVASAETVANLYQQRELVVGQGSSERLRAMSEALSTVLVRVSGQPAVLQSDQVKQALSSPEGYMEAYRYESGSTTVERDGQQVPATTIVLNFSRAGVEGLLRQAQLPLWPANRPSVLVWVVKDDFNQGRRLVSLQDEGELSGAVKEAARRRGLPVVTPLLDLEDQVSIKPDDLWALNTDAIMQASERYKADAVLVGRYSQASSGQWLSAWTLFHKQKQQVFDRERAEEAALLTDALDATSDYLADIYSINTNGARAGTVVMEIDQIQDFSEYVKTLSYLTDLDMVRQLDLLAVDGAKLQLMLKMDGDVALLANALELDNRLVTVAPKTGRDTVSLPASLEPQGSLANPLRYRWP
ncbi:DUF2066 domain-containing protein [Aestuariicella hydrocarbonica]|uniref:DUF2066 domain-containing protein n=1 Tax=Pseudomaricurvus hydrocarbonicus TaxID=1470433 RepID=A0A9E5MLA8_9GAMM|nr:DUF2066 domain-containing protein [Aestuariicella hydrocarbonica]NHO64163.1 DUF2066 domain-containing protein [Aestuariicella hydrocarbonica]